MKLHIIAVGTKMPGWVEAAYADYAKRFPKEFSNALTEIASEKSSNQSKEICVEREGQRILAALGIPTKSKTPAPKLTSPKPKPKLSAQKPKTTTYTIALDVRGNSLSTEQLAEKLKRWQMEFSTVNFLIGGPEGLSDICLNYADERLSLSELTFPHSLVRVMLIEQLYRAVSLLTGHPYHRA